MKKKIRLLFSLLLVIQLFPTSPIFAETVQDVPVGETTISSKAEDPLKEYQEKAQNQVTTVESTFFQDVPEVENETETSPSKIKDEAGESPTLEKGAAEEQEITNQRIEPHGGIVPYAGTTLVEGVPGDPLPYDIDRNFADVLRASYGAPASITDDFMENLTNLHLQSKGLTSLKGIKYAKNLTNLSCNMNNISSLDLRGVESLKYLFCVDSRIQQLDISENFELEYVYCSYNPIQNLDVSNLVSLIELECINNNLSNLNLKKSTLLKSLNCAGNSQIGDLDLSNNKLLSYLDCSDCGLRSLDVKSNTGLYFLKCSTNGIKELDVSFNNLLTSLDCSRNRIADITSTNNLNALSLLNAGDQYIYIPVPAVSITGVADIDVLRTTAHNGLSASNISINPPPSDILYNGDVIKLIDVTKDVLKDKSISFEYEGTQLVEGSSSYTMKKFSGFIVFSSFSDLKNELEFNKNKVKTGEEIVWTWTITSVDEKKAQNIKATFNLPNYVTGDISDILITTGTSSVPGDMNHLNGTTSLGDLDQGESIVITFKSVARGDPDTWYEAVGRLDWSDNTPSSPHFNESKQQFKIMDEEQTDTPKDLQDMGILSVPIYFNFGTQDIYSTLQTYSLHTQDYQSNTNVVTGGFYTRIKDERSASTGWKLTASLSEFVDGLGIVMPNGSGTSLKLDNMHIQKVTDRDTPQEAIDPSPTGTPNMVKTTETLVAGDTAKTLVSAAATEGDGTWQLRMPFDDLSLNIPANAGKKGTVYKAKLTWSLNNTP